jgi:hypothetical protein
VGRLLLLLLLLQKLAFIAAEIKLVPLESIAAVEGSIADYTQEQQDKVGRGKAAISCGVWPAAANSKLHVVVLQLCLLLHAGARC